MNSMTTYIIIGVIVILIASFVLRNIGPSSEKRKVFKNNTYAYTVKPLLMTQTEAGFFRKLEQAVKERYYVFPQVHMSAILDHHVKGQDWNYAFRHINGKSVDYVLCDLETLQPTYAIELDDYTHDRADRRDRDKEVERIFEAAHLPLVRFRNKDVTEAEIVQALTKANKE